MGKKRWYVVHTEKVIEMEIVIEIVIESFWIQKSVTNT